MRDLNKVMLIGRLGRDPEMRFLADGTAVTSLTLATGRQWKDAQGQQQEQTEWVPVVLWRKLGEIANQYLTKGRMIYVEGRLQTRSWDDDAGQKHYKTEVVAQDFIMLDGRRGDGPEAEGAGGEGWADETAAEGQGLARGAGGRPPRSGLSPRRSLSSARLAPPSAEIEDEVPF